MTTALPVAFFDSGEKSSRDIIILDGFSLVRLTGLGVIILDLLQGLGDASLSTTSSCAGESLSVMLGPYPFLVFFVSVYFDARFVTTELILIGSSPCFARGLKVKLSVNCVALSSPSTLLPL